MALLYQDLLARKELTPSGQLPLVLPIVLYNGENRWWAPLELSELIQAVPEAAQPYVPRLRYRLIDEGSYSAEELEERQNLVGALFGLEKSRRREDLKRWLDRLPGWLVSPPLDVYTIGERSDLRRCGSVLGAALVVTRGGRTDDPLVGAMESLRDVSMGIVDFAMRFAPIGVAGLMFAMAARFGFSLVVPLGKYVGVVGVWKTGNSRDPLAFPCARLLQVGQGTLQRCEHDRSGGPPIRHGLGNDPGPAQDLRHPEKQLEPPRQRRVHLPGNLRWRVQEQPAVREERDRLRTETPRRRDRGDDLGE